MIGVLAALFVSGVAAAQKPEADRLFDEGVALMNEGKLSDACPKLEASVKLDPVVGGMLWLADCYERAGRLHAAYLAFKDAEKRAIEVKDPKGRDKVAHDRADKLAPKIPRLSLVAPTPAPEGLRITCDGRELGPGDIGTPFMTDAGEHVVTIEALHAKRTEQKVVVPETGTASVVLVLATEKSEAPPTPPPDTGSPGTGMRIAGGAIGGVGLVGIVVGSVFGIIASSKLSQSNDANHCDAQNTCDPNGLSLRSQAKDAATVSTIMFVVGGVALATGITLFVLAPKSKSAVALVPMVTPEGGYATVSGRF